MQTTDDLQEDLNEKSLLLGHLPYPDEAVHLMRDRLKAASRSSDPVAMRALKRDALMLLRAKLLESAVRGVSANWQSPSAIHAVYDEAGNESGKIRLTMNDYKRDYHADATAYEQSFRRKYIDGIVTIAVRAHLVSSGMAGLTTILAFLLGEGLAEGVILAGTNTYFQSKDLIAKLLADRLSLVHESDTRSILAVIRDRKPGAVFLDSATNSHDMTRPDLTAIITTLVKTLRHDMALVIDNTCQATRFQPIPLLLGKHTRLRLFVYESLNKYHQFGADRVTAGIIWAYGPGTEKLFDYRKNCGTIIPDLSARALPLPDRALLDRRLDRMERNARFLAERLRPRADVAYTGGSLLAVRFGSAKQTISRSKIFLNQAINEAKKQTVPLVAGTSFGFDTTRIYLTASTSRYGEPFLRLAAGTEDADLLANIARIFENLLSRAQANTPPPKNT
jgi:hypothetical protein